MPAPVCLNNLQLIDRLTCYLELIGKIISELNLRHNQLLPGLAVNQLTAKLFKHFQCDSNLILDQFPDFQLPPEPECECDPDSIPTPDPDGCESEPVPEPVPVGIFVYAVYLLRENYSRYRIFDGQVYAIDANGDKQSLTKLIDPDTILIENPENLPDIITYSQALCCLRKHFEKIISYLKCCQC